MSIPYDDLPFRPGKKVTLLEVSIIILYLKKIRQLKIFVSRLRQFCNYPVKPSVMKKTINYDDKPIDLEDLPHISIIIPFSPEVNKPEGFFKRLALEADKAEKELMTKYSKEEACPLVEKLREAINEVECITSGKTLAIFVSQVAKKIYYFTPSNKEVYTPPVLVKNSA